MYNKNRHNNLYIDTHHECVSNSLTKNSITVELILPCDILFPSKTRQENLVEYVDHKKCCSFVSLLSRPQMTPNVDH